MSGLVGTRADAESALDVAFDGGIRRRKNCKSKQESVQLSFAPFIDLFVYRVELRKLKTLEKGESLFSDLAVFF